ncbi:MAG: hypothetical protein ACRDAG_01285 [Cetobacterium somerae]|uniref:hypothetical protein n=1 Tax=Cetobacterium somerae TaxID=188913 RepID=UPI003F3C2A87
MNSRYAVIDMETGHIVRETDKKEVAISETKLEVTKEMLLEPTHDIIKHIYRQMKISGKIDSYGMIEMEGLFVGEKFFEVGANAGVLAENFIRLKKVLSFRGFIKKNKTTDCENWNEVMEVLGIQTTNKRKVLSMKKLLIGNDIIRENNKLNGKKCYVVNPNVLRHGTHTSDYCIATFKDVALNKVDRYNTYLLYINGLVEYNDIK